MYRPCTEDHVSFWFEIRAIELVSGNKLLVLHACQLIELLIELPTSLAHIYMLWEGLTPMRKGQ